MPVALAVLAVLGSALPAAASARARPDLTVSRVTLRATGATSGDAISAAERVRNRGRRAAQRSVTGFYLSRDARLSRGDIQIGSRSVPKLKRARSSVARPQLKIGSFVDGGQWRLLACADQTRRVRESNERNNCAVAKTVLTVTRFLPPLRAITLAVTRDGSGSGTVTSSPAGIDCGAVCSAAFPGETAVTVTATPATGSRFAGWSGGCSGTEPVCSPTADVTATFVRRVLAKVSAGTGGNVAVGSSDPTASCNATSCTLDAGADAAFAAAPNPGYRFGAWKGGCAGGPASVSLSALSADVSCEAAFVKVSTVAWAVTGTPGGKITGAIASGSGSCTPNYCIVDSGGSISLSRSTPASGWRFGGWSGNCSVAGTGSGLTFPGLTTDKSCGATYIQQFKIIYNKTDPLNSSSNTVNAGLNQGVGSCSNGTCTVDAGSTVSLRASAGDASSQFLGWTGACSGTTDQIVLAGIAANGTCTARFDLK